jgi:hypothetical protein
MLIPLTLPKQSRPGRFGPDSAGRLVNCYVEEAGPEGKMPLPIYVNDGWTDYETLSGGSKIRAMLDLDGTLYVVSGRNVYQRTSAGVVTNLGSIGGVTTSGMVTMARNRAGTPQIGIVVDNLYYVISGGVLSAVTTNVRTDIVSCAVLDGFMVLFSSEGHFRLSTADDATAFDALDQARAEAEPDTGIINLTRNRDMLFFSSNSIEVWQNTGDVFPFTRSAVIARGTIAGPSVQKIGEQVFFVAENKEVHVLNGYTPQKISNHDVERSIAAESEPDKISALVWEDGGHALYELSGEGFTWIYDATTGSWSEAKSAGLNRSRAAVHVGYGGKHIFGDYALGKLYERAKGIYSENGDEIVWTIELPVAHNTPNKLVHHAIYVDLLTGTGDDSQVQPNDNPEIMLDYSDDGRQTWGAQRLIRVGKKGATKTRVTTRRLGQSKSQGRVYRLSGSASVAW